jgi:TatD DNase family protein
MIETHCHLDGVEFAEDRNQVVERARAAGVEKIFVPAIDAKSVETVLDTCRCYPDYCYPMLGLHPEEVRADWRDQLSVIRAAIQPGVIAIGEVGLDYYWSREYAAEQIEAFEQQVCWSIEMRLPLMIHCRKAQNEMVALLRKYKDDLPGGVFHCFTGNALEAAELLQFDRFVLGVGGVLTFKKSHLPEVLAAAVPMDRVVLETDSPSMAPVPHRGQRNEPAFVADVLQRMAESYGVSREEMERRTNENVERIFGIQ